MRLCVCIVVFSVSEVLGEAVPRIVLCSINLSTVRETYGCHEVYLYYRLEDLMLFICTWQCSSWIGWSSGCHYWGCIWLVLTLPFLVLMKSRIVCALIKVLFLKLNNIHISILTAKCWPTNHEFTTSCMWHQPKMKWLYPSIKYECIYVHRFI